MRIKTMVTTTGSALLGAALFGCGGSATAPISARASPFSLYTHCGINEIRIGTRFYAAEKPLNDGHGNPPAGWDNPYQQGTITITSASTATFRDGKNHRVVFHLSRRGGRHLVCD